MSSTKVGEDADLVPTTTNLDKEGLVPSVATLRTPQFVPPIMEYGYWDFSIPEGEEASVKDSITSGLQTREQNAGVEASGFGGQPMLSTVGQTKVCKRVVDDTNVEGKLAPIAKETKQKRKLTMDPMVEFSWRSKE